MISDGREEPRGSSDPGALLLNPLAGLRTDLHIHTVLSPCAEREMTPGNIVGMAILSELDVIAITDHQSCGNCAAAIAISQALDGPTVIPGMEVESAEEIHLLCLFPDLESARICEAEIQASQPYRLNRKDIFGEQWIMDENDERVGDEERMLLMPSQLSCDEIAARVISLGGVCIPAHLDREANSMLVSLGSVPPEFPTKVIELSRRVDPTRFFRQHPELSTYQFITNSDAHRLETLVASSLQEDKPAQNIDASEVRTRSRKTVKEIIQALRP